MTTFAALIATARRLSSQTAAEFDYSLARGDVDLGAFGPYGWLDLAAAQLTGSADAGKTLIAAHRADIAAMTTAAKAKSYTGWSSASRGPVRYADA